MSLIATIGSARSSMLADNAVPVCLRVVRHTVGVVTDIDVQAIIDSDGDCVSARCQAVGQVIFVWHT